MVPIVNSYEFIVLSCLVSSRSLTSPIVVGPLRLPSLTTDPECGVSLIVELVSGRLLSGAEVACISAELEDESTDAASLLLQALSDNPITRAKANDNIRFFIIPPIFFTYVPNLGLLFKENHC